MSVTFACLCMCTNAQNCLEVICLKWVTLKTVKLSLNKNLEITKALSKKGKSQMQKSIKNCIREESSEWKQQWSKPGMTLPEDTSPHSAVARERHLPIRCHKLPQGLYSATCLSQSLLHLHCFMATAKAAIDYYGPKDFFARCHEVIPDALSLLECLHLTMYSF